MSKYMVYKNKKLKHITPVRVDKDWDFVGSFEADVECDYIMSMIGMNEKAEHIDKYWDALSKKIEREGI